MHGNITPSYERISTIYVCDDVYSLVFFADVPLCGTSTWLLYQERVSVAYLPRPGTY